MWRTDALARDAKTEAVSGKIGRLRYCDISAALALDIIGLASGSL